MEKLFIKVLISMLLLSNSFVDAECDEIDDIIPFVIQVESGGNPDAVSPAGAIGLCQVTSIVLKEWNQEHPDVSYNEKGECAYALWGYGQQSIKDLFEPAQNIIIGTWYLRRLRDHYLKDVRVQRVQIPKESKDYFIVWEQINYKPTYYQNSNQHAKDYNLFSLEDMELALILAAYNGGITRLRNNNYDINKMPKETRQYVKKVMKLYQESKKEIGNE